MAHARIMFVQRFATNNIVHTIASVIQHGGSRRSYLIRILYSNTTGTRETTAMLNTDSGLILNSPDYSLQIMPSGQKEEITAWFLNKKKQLYGPMAGHTWHKNQITIAKTLRHTVAFVNPLSITPNSMKQ